MARGRMGTNLQLPFVRDLMLFSLALVCIGTFRSTAISTGKSTGKVGPTGGVAVQTVRMAAVHGSPSALDTSESRAAANGPDRVIRGPELDEVVSLARRQISMLDERAKTLPENRGITHFMQNPGQGMALRFGRGRVEVADWKAEARQVTFGYAGAGPASTLKAAGTRASYTHRDGVVEWFENGRDGVLHGFELAARNPGSDRREVKVAMDGMTARTARNGKDLEWLLPDGEPALAYAGLKAWDAVGMDLPATMEPCHGGFRILVDDRNARYPIHIDPLLTRMTAKLGVPVNTGDGETADRFGRSVATDGTRLAIGARTDSGTGSVYIFERVGAEWIFETKVVPPDGKIGDWFGESVAIEGNLMVVGATGASGTGLTDLGAAYVFERLNDTWTVVQKLAPAGGWLGDYFGSSVAIQGDRILVGANAANDFIPHTGSPGYACLYERSGGNWSEQARLVDPQGLGNDNFGHSVALEGDRAFVGKPTNGTGEVLVFRQESTSWTLEARLGGKFAGDRFGHSVSVDGDLLAVGAQQADTPAGTAAGNVELFRGTGTAWLPEATLSASNGGAGEWFGSSIAVDGGTVLVGATYSYYGYGAAYAFQKPATQWVQAAHLVSPSSTLDGRAGSAVALKGDLAFIGAYGTSTYAGDFAGAVHHFVRSGGVWGGYQFLSSGDGNVYQEFGRSLDLDGDRLAVGMPDDATPYGPQCGTVYLFTRDGEDWLYEQTLNDSDPVRREVFGTAVHLQDDLLVVGTPLDVIYSSNPSDITPYRYGSVSCYRREAAGWIREAKLRPLASQRDDSFGIAVSLDGPHLLVGAPRATTGSFVSTGAGHLFRREGTNWIEEARLVPPSPTASGSMGSQVILQGDRALLADSFYPNPAATHETGGIREFVKSGGTWSHVGVIVPTNRIGNALFGVSIAMDGDLLLAGSSAYQPGTPEAAYLFRRTGTVWTQEAVLQSPDPDALTSRAFGTVVALDGSTAAVGAPGGGTGKGSIHIFRPSSGGWQRDQRITAPDSHMSEGYGVADVLGASLDLEADLLVAGATGDAVENDLTGDLAKGRGSVYVFALADGWRRIEVRNESGQTLVTGDPPTHFGVGTVSLLSPRREFVLLNHGTLPLGGISVELGGPDAGDFRVATAPPSTLPAGNEKSFAIQFLPLSGGDKSAWLDLSSDDPASPVVRLEFTGYANRLPLGRRSAFRGIQGKPVIIFLEDLAYDPDGDDFAMYPSGPVNVGIGTIFNTETTLVFQPNPGFTGDRPIFPQMIDEHGASTTLFATITVVPASAFPGLAEPVFQAGDGIRGVTLRGLPDHDYRVERSEDLKTWEVLGSARPDSAGDLLFFDYGQSSRAGFYRLAD